MTYRRLALAAGASALVLVSATPAMAAWSAAGTGKASAAAGAMTGTPPSGINITACTASDKSATNIITGTVTASWTVSNSTQATGQKVYTGSGSPTVWTTPAASTIGNNTTASATVPYSILAGTVSKVGVQATLGGWGTAISASADTFTPAAGGGSNGSCGHT